MDIVTGLVSVTALRGGVEVGVGLGSLSDECELSREWMVNFDRLSRDRLKEDRFD
jgi:hypothetical protein